MNGSHDKITLKAIFHCLLLDLFGGGLDDSGNSGSMFSGASWRRRLMPKTVAVISAGETQDSSPSSEPTTSNKTSPNNSKSYSVWCSGALHGAIEWAVHQPKLSYLCRSFVYHTNQYWWSNFANGLPDPKSWLIRNFLDYVVSPRILSVGFPWKCCHFLRTYNFIATVPPAYLCDVWTMFGFIMLS